MHCFDGSSAYQLLLGKMEQNVIKAGESQSCSIGKVPWHVIISVGEARAPAAAQGNHRELHQHQAIEPKLIPTPSDLL